MIENCLILVTEYLTVHEAIVLTIQKNLRGIITENDSKLVGNSIITRFVIRRDIMSLVRDIT